MNGEAPTMQTLTFDAEDVRRVVEHSIAAPTQSARRTADSAAAPMNVSRCLMLFLPRVEGGPPSDTGPFLVCRGVPRGVDRVRPQEE